MNIMLRAVFAVTITTLSLCFASDHISSDWLPCPNIKERNTYDITQVLGEWYVALMLMDAQSDEYEEYQEQDSCVHGDLHLVNSTTIIQSWSFYSMFAEYGTTVHIPTKILQPNEWEILTPLGGIMNITISHISPGSHITLTFCGTQSGQPVHLWTVLLTRKPHTRPSELVGLVLELLVQGFDIHNNKLIRGNYC